MLSRPAPFLLSWMLFGKHVMAAALTSTASDPSRTYPPDGVLYPHPKAGLIIGLGGEFLAVQRYCKEWGIKWLTKDCIAFQLCLGAS